MTTSQIIILAVLLLGLCVLIFLASRKRPLNSELEAQDAKRFARLLVIEIKLYETYKVERGLKSNDLLGSLADEIAAARKKYNRQCSDSAAFDDALVAVLADGDASKLGPNFKQNMSNLT